MADLILCDRCLKIVEGAICEKFTSGVYVVKPGSCWARFARKGEAMICDACMWADPAYIKLYGKRVTA